MNATAEIPASATPAPTRVRPLLTVRGMVSLIVQNEDRCLGLIESGELRWAWNVALEPERAKRMELRVLPECVADFLDGRRCELEWPDVLQRILPHDEPLLKTKEMEMALNVSNAHVLGLLRRGAVEAAGAWGPGPGHSAMVTRKSLIRFLGRRCYPVPVGDN